MIPRLCTYAVITVTAGVVVGLGLLRANPGSIEQAFSSEIYAPSFRHLTDTRQNRKAQVEAYFDAAHRLAAGVTDDSVMMAAFSSLRGKDGPPSGYDDLALDVHCVSKYAEFFDILLVDRSGYVFHSMRRESDYHSNLFDGPLADTKLARRLPSVQETTFIDYEPYPPSDEPGAFFAVPVFERGGRDPAGSDPGPLGWFVLQCSLNKLNSIVADRRNLGRTGEVYLVNTEQRMVTDSRFRAEPADLQVKVDTMAVAAAHETGAGERVIRDYRGVRVLSSFESFELFGTTWVIVAEIDEDEVVTEHYKQHRAFYGVEAARYLGSCQVHRRPSRPRPERAKRVDMNEFAKAVAGTALTTSGVAVCTAITAVLPGRFGYLAHIGPSDLIYGKPDLGHNDCLGKMLSRLYRYDVYPYELPELEFTIIATHQESFARSADRLVDLGAELSQIRFAYNPAAYHANVVLVPETESVLIEWVAPTGVSTLTVAGDVEDLGDIVKHLAAEGKRALVGQSG